MAVKIESTPIHSGKTAPSKKARIVRMPEILERTGFKSRSSVYRAVKAGILPPLVKLVPSRERQAPVGMFEDELDACLEALRSGATKN